jgi:hypothetical protein
MQYQRGHSGNTLRRIPRATIMIRISFKTLSVGLIALACLLSAPAGADQITYDMVTVGNPGNANDTGGTSNGAVNYEYQIGKYDVTIGQYTAFLNAVAATDTYSLYNAGVAFDLSVAGISRTGASGWLCNVSSVNHRYGPDRSERSELRAGPYRLPG